MKIEELSNEELSKKASDWNALKKIGKKIEEEVKRRCNEGIDVPNCSIGKPGQTAFVSNVGEALKIMKDQLGLDFDRDRWNSLLSISPKQLKDWLHDMEKPMEALDPVIGYKPKAGSIRLPKTR